MPSVSGNQPAAPGVAGTKQAGASPRPAFEADFHGRKVSIYSAGESKASSGTVKGAGANPTLGTIPTRLADRKASIGAGVTGQRPVNYTLASDAIPTSTAVRQAYGEPKADVVGMGITLKKNSTAYRQVLAQLDAYHNACTLGKRERNFMRNADMTLTALQGLQKALANYVSDAGRSRVEGLQELLVTVTNEFTRIASLPGQLAQLRKDKPSLAAIPEAELAHLLSVGVTADLMASGYRLHLRAAEIEAHHRARLPINEATVQHDFTQATLVRDSVTVLGKGAISTVLQADYVVDGRRTRMVFKPETPGISLGHAAELAGISVADPNMTGRSVATHAYARMLSLPLVPLTVPAVLNQVAGCLMERVDGHQSVMTGTLRQALSPQLKARLEATPEALPRYAREQGFTGARIDGHELVLERFDVQDKLVDGKRVMRDGKAESTLQPGVISVGMPFDNPSLLRDLTRAQWLDCATRQGDRHAQNIFFSTDASGALTVRLIDSACSFGQHTSAMDKVAGDRMSLRANLPPVIDKELREAFRNLDPIKLEAQLHGRLTPAEVEVTLADLEKIKKTLDAYDDEKGRVVENLADWSSPRVAELLGLDSEGEKVKKALTEPYKDKPPAVATQRNRLAKLQNEAGAISYVAREAMSRACSEWELAQSRRTAGARPAAAVHDMGRLGAILDEMEAARDTKAARTDI